MTSQGQRFRRRSLRRGYKVDEVDSFLDRVEATLNGDRIDAPVHAQEVHDVVFRVRFGGYDEWQVDLHLDRIERQLADQEPSDEFGADRMAPPDRMPDRMGSDRMAAERMPERMPDRMPPERMPAPPRDDRMMPPPMRDDRMMPPASERPPMPSRPMQPNIPPVTPAPAAGYPPRYDEPTYVGDQGYGPGPGRPGVDPGYGGYDASRHGRMDMTTEMRMPDTGPGLVPPGDVQRIDQLRRTFQLRRFGSGYDRVEVDRLFEGIINAMSGRSPMPATESELDPQQFSLVPGGYFEAEVDQALREVRDIFRRR